MSSVEVVDRNPVLGELAEAANREHALVMQAGESMVLHAIKAGEALLRAQEMLVADGEWDAWLAANFEPVQNTGYVYMRIAMYQGVVLESGVGSINAAKRLLAEKNLTRPRKSELAEQARRLCQSMSQKDAALILGVTAEQVTYWVNPDAYRRRVQSNRENRRRRAAERKALEREQRNAEIRRIGGPGAEAYSLLRRALQAAQQAHDEAPSPEVRAAYSTALRRGHAMEDEIAKAVRLS
jgi:hypothetical protein